MTKFEPNKFLKIRNYIKPTKKEEGIKKFRILEMLNYTFVWTLR